MIIEDALSSSRVPILLSTFKDMDREAFLETQVLALGENPTSSEEEGQEEEGEEEEVETDKKEEEEKEEEKIEEEEE